jgi:protein-L-isoaspartate(D-aspartate) O-methyltransferase
MVSFEWLELWLACTLDNSTMRMNVQRPAVDRGQVTPMFGWGSMATTRRGDLAYLTLRPAPPATDGGKRYEVGVIGHGLTGAALAENTAEQVRIWDQQFRHRTVHFGLPTTPPNPGPAAGQFVLGRPSHPITVQWQ